MKVRQIKNYTKYIDKHAVKGNKLTFANKKGNKFSLSSVNNKARFGSLAL
jgi:hypothetical protein